MIKTKVDNFKHLKESKIGFKIGARIFGLVLNFILNSILDLEVVLTFMYKLFLQQ